MLDLKLLFLQMAVILVSVRLAGLAFRWIGQPEVIGEMAAGILMGPSLLGHAWPAAEQFLFPANGLAGLYVLSQVGLVLFMFQVGLEMEPAKLRASVRSVLPASVVSMAAPLALGGAMAWALCSRLGANAPRLLFVLFVGAAMGITAFPVLARILADRGMMRTRVGQVALSCAAFDDLAAWCLLAVITVLARGEAGGALAWRFAGLLAYGGVMIFAVRPALKRLQPEKTPAGQGWFAVVMGVLLASVCVTESLGVHALFGAFMAGVVMPKGPEMEAALRGRLASVTSVLLLPLFFVYTGLRTSVGLVNGAELWLLCGVIVLVAVLSKLLASGLMLRATGMAWREALAVGVLVNTKGLVELVILNAGLDLKILSPVLFSMMVMMAFVTTFMTAPLLGAVYRGERTLGAGVESPSA